MKTMMVTPAGVQRLVRNAGEHLRRVNPSLPVKPENLIAAADKFGLPVGIDLAQDPVSRCIFIAAYSPDAHEQLTSGSKAVFQRYQQLASLEA